MVIGFPNLETRAIAEDIIACHGQLRVAEAALHAGDRPETRKHLLAVKRRLPQILRALGTARATSCPARQ